MRFTSRITHLRLPDYTRTQGYFIFTIIVILLSVFILTHPAKCQLSLWEETGAPGENPRLSAERRSFHMSP
jgi:hypothetical protein